MYVVMRIGDPLIPYGVTNWFTKNGLKLPDVLKFHAAALDPNWAPLVGNRRTYSLQRAAYIVIPQWLMAHRAEYAGEGVPLETLDQILKALGLYERSHASLVANVKEALMQAPEQPALDGPKSALLVGVEGRPGLVTLGKGHPEYLGLHDQLLDAAGAGARRKKREAIRAKKRRETN
jgi:hypothetical protein